MFDEIINSQKIYLIGELHPQHQGELSVAKHMALNCKIHGFDCVKLQIYDAHTMPKGDLKQYLEISSYWLDEFARYCEKIEIDFTFSIFDEKYFSLYDEYSVPFIKVASRSVSNKALINKIISAGRPTLISNGMFEIDELLKCEHIWGLQCVSKYPSFLGDFTWKPVNNKVVGYSCHHHGIEPMIYAAAHGACVFEKHITPQKGFQCETEQAHLGSLQISELADLRSQLTILRRMYAQNH